MARSREFDTETVLTHAMELFWLRGYEATSVRDLADHLGIGQGSLYAAFTSKELLYRACLEHYRDTFAATALEGLRNGEDLRTTVRALMLGRARIAVTDGGRGCLFVNAATERLPEDVATRRTVRDAMAASQQALVEVLRTADRGKTSPHRDPETLAAFLVTFLNGLLVTSKITPDLQVLEPLVEVALDCLD